MTNKQIDNRAKKLEALEAQIKELEAQAEAVKDEIKTELEARSLEELKTESGRVIRWKMIISSRFDTKAFKAMHPAMYDAFTKESASRRFTITA